MIDSLEIKNHATSFAKALLLSDDDYVDHILELWRIGNFLYGQVWHAEFHIFGVIESETDHLPTKNVRGLCSESWLAKVDKEIAARIKFYREDVTHACTEILAKHSGA